MILGFKKEQTMTSYLRKVTLNDSEAIMLRAALRLMIEHCEENLVEGAKAPFWAHKRSAENVLKKLDENIIQSTINSFCN